MTYADQAALSVDLDMQARITAAYAANQAPGATDFPGFWAQNYQWKLCATSGWADAYASGGQAAITDEQILSAIQALLAVLPS